MTRYQNRRVDEGVWSPADGTVELATAPLPLRRMYRQRGSLYVRVLYGNTYAGFTLLFAQSMINHVDSHDRGE